MLFVNRHPSYVDPPLPRSAGLPPPTLPHFSGMKETKKIRTPVEPWSFGSGLIVGCFLVLLMIYVMMSNEIGKNRSEVECMPPSSSPLSNAAGASSIGEKDGIQVSGFADEGRNNPVQGKESVRIEREIFTSAHVEQDSKDEEGIIKCDDPNSSNCKQGNTYDEQITVTPAATDSKESEKCDFSDFRFNACELEGDVRIVGKNFSSVILVTSSRRGGDGSWKIIKPYPRKYDSFAMAKVRPLNLTTVSSGAPRCNVNHSVPAVVFSTGGHCGNCFHDFADVLVPLFETAGPFNGRVQFVIASYQGWWMLKYRPYLARLSAFDVIDLDNDGDVHCFTRAVVGLRAGRDLMIDPAKAPPGNSITDFVALSRSAYELPRDRVSGEGGKGKPRILFIARRKTRRFDNMAAIGRVAVAVGFEVVVSEPDFFGVTRFARIVNSCDVMVGVHGAGLTNFLFLPAGGVMVQVVPLGKLDWIAANFYAEPAMGRGLRYLEYNISVEESTLLDLYPRNHTVFVDPEAVHKQGWHKLGDVYLKQQSVRLDLNRFRSVLEQAMDLLLHENN